MVFRFSAFQKLFHEFQNPPNRFANFSQLSPKLSVGAADKTKTVSKPKTKKQTMNNVTNYRHENITEESRIWPSPYSDGFKWANRSGEGECASFEEAVAEAEEALISGDAYSAE